MVSFRETGRCQGRYTEAVSCFLLPSIQNRTKSQSFFVVIVLFSTRQKSKNPSQTQKHMLELQTNTHHSKLIMEHAYQQKVDICYFIQQTFQSLRFQTHNPNLKEHIRMRKTHRSLMGQTLFTYGDLKRGFLPFRLNVNPFFPLSIFYTTHFLHSLSETRRQIAEVRCCNKMTVGIRRSKKAPSSR